jgi:hypothetical protein
MTLLGFKTILIKKNVGRQKFRGSSRKFLGAGPISSKMKTNFKKSDRLSFSKFIWFTFMPTRLDDMLQ